MPPLPTGTLAPRRAATRVTGGGVAVAALTVAALIVLRMGLGLGVGVNGFVLGLLTGVSAVGLALAWRTSRVVPFAHVAVGTAPTAALLTLTADGRVSWAAALALSVAVGGVLGAVTHRVAVHPFINRPSMAPAVALLAVATALSAVAVFAPRWVSDRQLPPAVVPGPLHERWLSPGGVDVRGDVVLVAVLTLACLGVVWAVLRMTSAGLLVAATADDPPRAALLGVPVQTVGTLAWAAAGVLATLAAFGTATVVGLPFGLADTAVALVPPLVAVAIMGPGRLVGVAMAGVALGVGEHALLAARLEPTAVDLVLVGVLVTALSLTRTRRLGVSSTVASDRLPLPVSSHPLSAAFATVVVGVAGVMVLGGERSSVVTLAVLTGLGALSLVVTVGWTGLLWLGHVVAAAAGAVVATLLAGAGLDLVACLAGGALAGGVSAAAITLPTVRSPGLLTAVSTLAMATAAPPVLLDSVLAVWSPTMTLPTPHLLGWVSLADERAFALTAVVVLGVAVAAVAHLRGTRTGRLLVATRDDAGLVRACAVSPGRIRLVASAIAGALAGVGGALLVLWAGAATAELFTASEGVGVLLAAVVGGVGSPAGALVGALLTVGGDQLLPGGWPFLLDVVVVVVILRVSPGGLVELPRSLAARRDRVRSAGRPAASSGLDCRGLVAGFGPQPVLEGVDLAARSGEIVGVLGRNGVGKSTLLGALAGVVPLRRGSVALGGADLTAASVGTRVRRGLRYVPADRPVLSSLSPDQHAALVGARETAVALAHLRSRRDVPAGSLSGGEQRLLAVGLALEGAPEAVLLDEPTLGLAPREGDATRDAIRTAAREGAAVVVAESSASVLAPLVDRIVVLEQGRLRPRQTPPCAHGAPASGRTDVLAPPASRPPSGPVGPPVLGLICVSARRGSTCVLAEVTLQLRGGEAVALLGRNGAGKSTLIDVAAGDVAPAGGVVALRGEDVTGWATHRRAAAGVARVFQLPRAFWGLTVAEAIAVGCERHYPVPDHLADVLALPAVRRAERDMAVRVDDVVGLLGLGTYRSRRTGELSLGWRRRVALGVAFASDPVVLLLDEPSAGLDAEHRSSLPALLRTVIAESGCAVLLAEHDITVAQAVADRSVHLVDGRLHEEAPPEE